MARLCESPSIQEKWARWTGVTRREEIRTRLELIGRFQELDPSLHDFLLFFLRASDPSVYQAAAVAVGRHLLRAPPLFEAVSAYAGSRQLSLDAPVPLTGVRGNRRILLVLASAASAPRPPAPELRNAPVTTTPVDPGAPLPTGSSDLGAHLLALELLSGGPKPDPDLETHALHAVRSLAESGRDTGDRVIQRRWGSLLAVLARRETPEGSGGRPLSEEAGELWIRRVKAGFRSYRELTGEAFPERVRTLGALDELLRTGGLLPEGGEEELARAFGEALSGEAKAFAVQRTRAWARRDNRNALSRALTSVSPGAAKEHGELLKLLDPPRAAGEGDDAGEEAGDSGRRGDDDPRMAEDGDLLGPRWKREARGHGELLLERITSRGRWLGMSGEERALTAHLLLDLAFHSPLPPDELRDLTASRGLLDPAPEPERGDDGKEPGKEVAAALLLRLIALEGTGSEALVDPRLLHRMDDDRILLALLPTRRRSELLPTLADAFEHRLRKGLAGRAGFDPDAFLLRTSIRKPHPEFYRLLRELSADREYRDAEGEPYPLQGRLERLRDEEPLRDSEARIRDELGRATEPGSLPGRVEGLLEAVSRTGGETEVPDLLGLIEGLRLSHASLLRSGDSPWEEVDETDLEEEMSRIRGRITQSVAHLQPASFPVPPGVKSAVNTLRQQLRELESRFAPLLPAREAADLSATVRSLTEGVESWAREVSVLEEAWEGTEATPDPEIEAERRERLFRRAAGIDAPQLRQTMLEWIWRALDESVDSGEDRWEERYGLLRWAADETRVHALDSLDRDLWLTLLTGTWADLAEEAVEAGYETRGARLARDPAFRPLRTRSGAEGALERLRIWSFDCYRIGDAVALTRSLNAGRGRGFVTSIPRDVLGFFLHYSPVWISLLIGAVLMLDFGDAWTTMAEVGDVRGISITFLLGLLGAYGYVAADLGVRVRDAPEDRTWRIRGRRLGRVAVFVGACLFYSVAVTAFLWLLLSGTDEVVHGPGAVLHVVVWSGFALFVGVFFGLLAKAA